MGWSINSERHPSFLDPSPFGRTDRKLQYARTSRFSFLSSHSGASFTSPLFGRVSDQHQQAITHPLSEANRLRTNQRML